MYILGTSEKLFKNTVPKFIKVFLEYVFLYTRNFILNMASFPAIVFGGLGAMILPFAFAIALTLATMFSENKKLKWGVLNSALYIGIGVSFNIYWFSEFVAGAIIGSAIGIVVGRSFKEHERTLFRS